MWLIYFLDNEIGDEVFEGEGAEDAAKERFEQCSFNWNCVLFKENDRT